MSDPVSEVAIGQRRLELATRLAAVRQSIADAATATGRKPSDITLVVVTKTWPPTDVRILADLGVGDVGENRAQEAAAKHSKCSELPLRWHFIGQLQTNKCHLVVDFVDLVHSVDRSSLVTALDRSVLQARREPLMALVQVNLDAPSSVSVERGGVAPAQALALAAQIASTGGLILGGVMGVAPLGVDPQPAFEQLREVSEAILDEYPSATIVSAGMSGDYVAAINAGATHVRMGAAVLGRRAYLE